jgi:outer membrane lipoprotein-sorting protein
MWLALVMVLSVPGQEKNAAELLFHQMEATLSKAKALELSFDVTVEEGQAAIFKKGTRLKGALVVTSGNKLRLEMSGGENDMGKPFKVLIISDGAQWMTTVEGEEKPKASDAPKNLTADFLTVVARPGVFMSRMPQLPLKIDDLKDALPVSGFKFGKREKVDPLEPHRLDYELTIKGEKPTYAVTVWIDPKTGLPVKRLVAGEVDGKKFAYSETYTKLTLDGKVDAVKFELPK